MAITTQAQYKAALKPKVRWFKTINRIVVIQSWFSLFEGPGVPAGGSLAATNSANGIVPTNAVAGYPILPTIPAGMKGYVGRVDTGAFRVQRQLVSDRVFHAGPYNFGDIIAVNLTAQPSFASRLPNTNYNECQIWIETVTAGTGNPAPEITYTDQNGNAGATTGPFGLGAAPTLGRCWQMPLAPGDSGVRKIESVNGTVATTGTFNIMVLRPLFMVRNSVTNTVKRVEPMESAGFIEVPPDAAIFHMINVDSTASSQPECSFELVMG